MSHRNGMIMALLLLFLTLAIPASAQFEGEWYSFRIQDLQFITISKQKLVTGRLADYGGPRQYEARRDSFTILDARQSGDSVLYLVTHLEPDGLVSGRKPLLLHKFGFNRRTNSITWFYYDAMRSYLEKAEALQDGRPDLDSFILNDTTNTGYMTAYRMDTIRKYLSWPRLEKQPKAKLLIYYRSLRQAYAVFARLPERQQEAYFMLHGMAKSAIRVPILISLKINPLIAREGGDEIRLRERFKHDPQMLRAIENL